MLRLLPDQRARAGELVHHQWLEGIIVQGELDVLHRAEEADADIRARTRSSASREREPVVEDDGIGGDALKPVEGPDATETQSVPTLATPQPASAKQKENAPVPVVPGQ
jgi:serine/threonine-protein kinase SRPK3